MAQEESLASKISAARSDMPPKATWWPRHCRTAADYLLLSDGRAPNGLAAAREAALAAAAEWDAWLPKAVQKGGMRRHVALEIELVRAARKGDAQAVEKVGALLFENAKEQAEDIGAAVLAFPTERLRRLLQEHVSLFAEMVRSAMEGGDGKPCAKAREANALALADLTVEWL